jgi:hypothetical protein
MIRITIAAAVFLASPIGAIAAPFCLALPNSTPQCMYVDGASCARDARQQNGSCQVNPAEIRLPVSRVGGYCLVMPSGDTRCGYADGNLCSRDALVQKGACELSSATRTQRIPDAYAPNAGR